MTQVHYLKTVNPFFSEVWLKRKTFEVRKNDINFKVGDTVVLQEYELLKKPIINKEHPELTIYGTYSGNQVYGTITYILSNYKDALHEDYIIFSFVENGRNYNLTKTTI